MTPKLAEPLIGSATSTSFALSRVQSEVFWAFWPDGAKWAARESRGNHTGHQRGEWPVNYTSNGPAIDAVMQPMGSQLLSQWICADLGT